MFGILKALKERMERRRIAKECRTLRIVPSWTESDKLKVQRNIEIRKYDGMEPALPNANEAKHMNMQRLHELVLGNMKGKRGAHIRRVFTWRVRKNLLKQNGIMVESLSLREALEFYDKQQSLKRNKVNDNNTNDVP